MEINLDGIVIIVGNYGSGKTEVSINLAANRRRAGAEVVIADLDLVNPYFRTREAKDQLSALGIDVVVPPERYLKADLPILSPAVGGLIRNPHQLTLLDVGGDDVGATVLATLGDALRGRRFRVIQIVNPFRPFTETLEGCLKIRDAIENSAKIAITGIAGNANLIDETTVANVYAGYEFVKLLSEESRLPLEFITVAANLLPEVDLKRFSCPALTIQRQLVPPWKKAQGL